MSNSAEAFISLSLPIASLIQTSMLFFSPEMRT